MATAEEQLRVRMEAYDHWKSDLAGAIREYQDWLDRHEMGEGAVELRLFEAIKTLDKDSLTIAFVAEFSRGKTELINAIFFADYQRRLLPSEAGRTTMCPTELFYDREAGQAYIRLLPIETRLEDTSLNEYKENPVHWVTTPLDVNSPEQMAESLKQVVKTKRVTRAEADRLGLYNEEALGVANDKVTPPTHVDIPMWRHAVISLPHPLLKQGLVILDTPGLNALGTEPELTINMLPSAQAVLFVLAADTGVTRSDLDMWQHYVSGVRSSHPRGLMVVLNKTDTLWDELKPAEAVESTIATQVRTTSDQLHVEPDNVFPISAQKGLVAKVRGDRNLLQRSRLPDLEQHLAEVVLPDKQRILRDTVASQVGALVENSRHVIETRLDNARKQREELNNLSGKNTEVIAHLMRKTREEQAAYMKSVENFQASHRVLTRQARAMLDTLSLEALDDLIARTREDMVGSWTTHGLKKGMLTFFDGARQTMQQTVEQAERTRRLIQSIYKKFHEEHGLPVIAPKAFDIDQYNRELELLYEEAEAFRNSPTTALIEQSFVVKKFFISLVSQARNLYLKANQHADNWLKEVMNPLALQIREHKTAMEKRLDTLRRINESRDTLEQKIADLEQQIQTQSRQLQELDDILKKLNASG